jgi:hypothetical protein
VGSTARALDLAAPNNEVLTMRFLQGALLGSVASLAALLWARTLRRRSTDPAAASPRPPTDRFPAAFRQWIDESPALEDPVEEVVREIEAALV